MNSSLPMTEAVTQGIKQSDMEAFEIDQLLEAIYFRYGYDFRQYARASLVRRIKHRVTQSGLDSIAEMIPKMLYDPSFFDLFLKDMSVTVTEMFRDPSVFKAIRSMICPSLATYARFNVWHAGCATGEEVYSLAILLHEASLLSRATLYATDYNSHSLAIANKGIYPAERMQRYTENYLASGGQASFADYYSARFESAVMDAVLKQQMVFANHNLMRDGVFAQMQIILCRNVMIYFDKQLTNTVLELFTKSLVPRGFLVLGDKESLDYTSVREFYECISEQDKIYQKKNIL